MIRSITLLTSLFCLLQLNNASAQAETTYFVQFKILKVNTTEEAKAIDKKLGSKKGMLSTHTDYKTSTYFCTLSADSQYNFEDFESWFLKLGYEISCFNKGIHGVVSMISPHELKSCEEFNKK